jgi:putative aldouronate transport system permease protein
MSSAVGLFQSVVGFIMVITANTIAKKMSDDASLF